MELLFAMTTQELICGQHSKQIARQYNIEHHLALGARITPISLVAQI
jgi:hypothetical protein